MSVMELGFYFTDVDFCFSSGCFYLVLVVLRLLSHLVVTREGLFAPVRG